MDVPINQPISQGHKNQGEVRSGDLCPHLSSEVLGEAGQPLGGTSRRQRVYLKEPDRKKEKVGVHDLLENMESFLEEANPSQLAYPTTPGPRDSAHFSSTETLLPQFSSLELSHRKWGRGSWPRMQGHWLIHRVLLLSQALRPPAEYSGRLRADPCLRGCSSLFIALGMDD